MYKHSMRNTCTHSPAPAEQGLAAVQVRPYRNACGRGLWNAQSTHARVTYLGTPRSVVWWCLFLSRSWKGLLLLIVIRPNWSRCLTCLPTYLPTYLSPKPNLYVQKVGKYIGTYVMRAGRKLLAPPNQPTDRPIVAVNLDRETEVTTN